MFLLLSVALAAPCAITVENGEYRPTQTIGFAPSTAEPTADALEAMAALACTLKESESRQVHIGVHTDSRGSSAYNQKMSQDRADALKSALLAAGAAKSQVSARGYGEVYPIASNATAEGRGQNRRVELLLEDPKRPDVAQPPPAPPPPPAPAVDPVCRAAKVLVNTGSGDFLTDRATSTVSEALVRCFGGSADRDGNEVFVTTPNGALFRVTPNGVGSRVVLSR